MISCSYCENEVSPKDETAYFEGKIFHADCLGDLLEERKQDVK